MNSKFAESTNKASEGLNLDIGIIRFKRLSSSAFAPTKGSEDSAGVDLISPHDWVGYFYIATSTKLLKVIL